MKTRTLIGTAALGLALIGGTSVATSAHALVPGAPNCGGQDAAGNPNPSNGQPQPAPPVPYTCNLPGRDVTFQGVTRHFSAVVRANGVGVTVEFTMTGGVLPVDVPIRIVHHVGISGNATPTDPNASGVIKAGQTTATLSDSAPCQAGQLDVKAVFTANSQDQGRVGGPWITNGNDCSTPTTSGTTVPTTVAPTTPTSFPSGGTSAPGTTVASPPVTVVPTSAGVAAVTTGTLPTTGPGGGNALPIALVGASLGGLLIFGARRRAAA